MYKPTLAVVFWAVLLFFTFLIGYVVAGTKYLPPHFHANFALYINGERYDFSGDEFMEDVEWCGLSDLMFPEDRVHLHENNPDTIHVHDEWVSWGHFFANNGFTFGQNFISLPSWEIFKNAESQSMHFYLNGEPVENPYNTLIHSKDRLLITYGDETPEERVTLSQSVSDNAEEYNDKYDPGSCGGKNEWWVSAVLKDLFWGLSH